MIGYQEPLWLCLLIGHRWGPANVSGEHQWHDCTRRRFVLFGRQCDVALVA